MKKIIILLIIVIIAVILVYGGYILWRRYSQPGSKSLQVGSGQTQKTVSSVSTTSAGGKVTVGKSSIDNSAATASGQKSQAEKAFDQATDLNISSEAAVKAIDTMMKPVFNKTWGGAKLTAYNTNAYNYGVMAGGILVTYKVKKEISVNDTNTLIANLKSAGITVKMSQQDNQSAELSVMKDNVAYDISYDIGDQEVMVGMIGVSANGDDGDS